VAGLYVGVQNKILFRKKKIIITETTKKKPMNRNKHNDSSLMVAIAMNFG
jgi:hypothetical protein